MSSVSRLATNTDAKIVERISESVTSYVTESNENTIKLDIVFDSFHYHAKIPISDILIDEVLDVVVEMVHCANTSPQNHYCRHGVPSRSSRSWSV